MDYQNFEKYLLRTPLFSFSKYQNLTAQERIADDKLKEVCKDPLFKEAIFLASPSLHQSMEKWLNNEAMEDKKLKRLKLSLVKYASRISSRCTPFGLFAGCSVGNFSTETKIELEKPNNHRRHTELDMNLSVALAQNLAEINTIKQQLLFFPNTSIYQVRDKLRYVEYTYINNVRQHQITSVDHSEYLQEILDKAGDGAQLKDLANAIVEDDIPFEDAFEFVEELVDSQLLISELEPSISGEPFFHQIIQTLKRIDGTDEILEILETIVHQIERLDTKLGNGTEIYASIEEELKKLDIDYDKRFLFQTDMITRTQVNTIDGQLINGLKKVIDLISKISLPPKETPLERFRSSFYKRFEEREVSLSKALDMETGIHYYPEYNTGEINPLVDDLILNARSSNSKDIEWSPLDKMLQQKILAAYQTQSYGISLSDEDFAKLKSYKNTFSDTFYVFTELIEIDGVHKLTLKAGGSASAATILGRFCHGNPALHEYVKEIIDLETQINKDKIVAEVLHLPEARVGNVLKRPELREFEIPYLSKSNKPKTHQLTLDDLVISAPFDKKVVLRSKKHQKEVVTRLTNAHNYMMRSLPIYHFLCDLQVQEEQNHVSFSLGPFAGEYEFLPRIEYENTIIHKATWNLKADHIKQLLQHSEDDKALLLEMAKLRSRWQLPQFVVLAEADNHLLINLENSTSIQMFLAEVKKRKKFKLIEFFFGDKGLVKQQDEYYTNEVIVSFFNQKKWKA